MEVQPNVRNLIQIIFPSLIILLQEISNINTMEPFPQDLQSFIILLPKLQKMNGGILKTIIPDFHINTCGCIWIKLMGNHLKLQFTHSIQKCKLENQMIECLKFRTYVYNKWICMNCCKHTFFQSKFAPRIQTTF